LIIVGLSVAGIITYQFLKPSASKTKTPDQKVTGLPSVGSATWRLEQSGLVTPMIDGKPLYAINAADSLVGYQKFASVMSAAFTVRRMTLPSDALKESIDAYSKELHGLQTWMVTGSNWIPYDEFGRVKPGQYGSGGGLIESTLAPFTKNPLGKAVVTVAVVAFGGPAGIAVLGAYQLWQARGQEFSLKNLALTAARTAAVSQCGEACGLAFDMGVGILQGKSVDKAAEDALLAKMTPEQRAYYEQAKAVANKSGVAGIDLGAWV
jgi:hypothetical protein